MKSENSESVDESEGELQSYNDSGSSKTVRLNGNDLISWGWTPGPTFKDALAKANELITDGLSLDEIRNELEAMRPIEVPMLHLRKTKLEYSVALRSENEIEQQNVAKVSETMDALMRTPVLSQGAVMPDACPAGPVGSIPVGGAVVSEAIHPAFHSADICCSMWVTLFDAELDGQTTNAEFMDALQSVTRFGPGGRPESNWISDPVIDELEETSNPFLTGLADYGRKHLCDQGDGNHFAYLGEWNLGESTASQLETEGYPELAKAIANRNRVKALVTHHGSRGLGARVYQRGIKVAEELTRKIAKGIRRHQAWIPTDCLQGQEYWAALQYVSAWTKRNHQLVHELTAEKLGIKRLAEFGNEHNFVWQRGNHFYHGKGATPAWRNAQGGRSLGVIPLNMSEPILIVLGNDNEEFCSFAPHGAGRNFSRKHLIRSANLNDLDETAKRKEIQRLLEQQTEGLDVRFYNGVPDLSETPMAYKSANSVRAQIDEFSLAETVGVIQPIGCIMAGDFPANFKSKK